MERQVDCLRCHTPMKYLKEYRFDSQDQNRGILGSLFDVEERLIFHVYVCPSCRHTEFFFSGTDEWFDR